MENFPDMPDLHTPQTPPAIVELDGVIKHFGDVAAVNGVSASIHEGEFFSLLGPSGCGKTTLLRIIAGFEQPTAGSIAIAGTPMQGVEANERPTNMVFQSYAIFRTSMWRRTWVMGSSVSS